MKERNLYLNKLKRLETTDVIKQLETEQAKQDWRLLTTDVIKQPKQNTGSVQTYKEKRLSITKPKGSKEVLEGS